MKAEFLRHTSSSKLILIFAGWSTRPQFYSDICRKGWDVLVVYDYTELDFPHEMLADYETIWLFAWSLGVFAAEISLDSSDVTAAIAVNGTPEPVSDEYGIPENIYKATAENLNRQNLIKFRKRMAGSSQVFKEKFNDDFSDETVSELQRELFSIYDLIQSPLTQGKGLTWNRAFISLNDRIFPAANMKTAWEKRNVPVSVLDSGDHYVDLAAIVDTLLPDPEIVGKKFAEANSSTYDKYAFAQHKIASRLMERLLSLNPKSGKKILEVGCGSGFLSKKLGEALGPSEAHFVDLATPEIFGIAPEEKYISADAEEWIKECEEKYDLIVSASTVQWFSDLRLFLKNCSKALRSDGILAFSTFLPGNLEELDSLRPSPLLYHPAETLRRWLDEDFKDIEISAEKIKLEFDTPREAMMHLKYTGVAGSSPSSGINLLSIRNLKTLTYLPLYVVCRRK